MLSKQKEQQKEDDVKEEKMFEWYCTFEKEHYKSFKKTKVIKNNNPK